MGGLRSPLFPMWTRESHKKMREMDAFEHARHVYYKHKAQMERSKQRKQQKMDSVKSEPTEEKPQIGDEKPQIGNDKPKDGELTIEITMEGKVYKFGYAVLAGNYSGQKTESGLKEAFRTALKPLFGARINDLP